MGGRFLDTAQVAQRIGCSTGHVATLIKLGKLKAIDIGAGSKLPRYRISEDALAAFMQTGESVMIGRLKTQGGVP